MTPADFDALPWGEFELAGWGPYDRNRLPGRDSPGAPLLVLVMADVSTGGLVFHRQSSDFYSAAGIELLHHMRLVDRFEPGIQDFLQSFATLPQVQAAVRARAGGVALKLWEPKGPGS